MSGPDGSGGLDRRGVRHTWQGALMLTWPSFEVAHRRFVASDEIDAMRVSARARGCVNTETACDSTYVSRSCTGQTTRRSSTIIVQFTGPSSEKTNAIPPGCWQTNENAAL